MPAAGLIGTCPRVREGGCSRLFKNNVGVLEFNLPSDDTWYYRHP